MHSDESAQTNGQPPFAAEGVGSSSELERLRATCRRQARVIARLRESARTLYRRATALKAHNAELRAENARMRDEQRLEWPADGQRDGIEPIEVCLPLDLRAPRAARIVVERCLGDRVEPAALDSAKLLISELVTNSVRHSGGSPDDPLLVRLGLARATLRLEVEDRGRGSMIAPHPPDPETGAGFGLNLVQTLSERWGVERVTDGGTRVWAQIRPPVPGDTAAPAANARVELSSPGRTGQRRPSDTARR